MDQNIIDRAVNIATAAAMNQNPVESITWIPPQSAVDDPDGYFAVKYYDMSKHSTAESFPWE